MSKTDITVVVKGALEALPPCVMHIQHLQQLGLRVKVIAGACHSDVAAILRRSGIVLEVLSIAAEGNRGGRFASWFEFRKLVVERLESAESRDSYLWVGTADTALAIGDYLLRGRPFGVVALELYDKVPHYRVALGPLARRADFVVVPEETRAQLLAHWWRLDRLPIVVPNKPFLHPRVPRQHPSREDTRRGIAALPSGNVIAYQGLIASQERNLHMLSRAIQDMGEPYHLVLMGPDLHNVLGVMREANPNLVHIERIPAPFHLEVTSHAWLGVATYTPWSLNAMLCAPNKIYEYAGFGIPVLGNRVPGLLNTVERFGAGLCVDTDDMAAIQGAIHEAFDEYDSLVAGAHAMYDSVDNGKALAVALAQAGILVRAG